MIIRSTLWSLLIAALVATPIAAYILMRAGDASELFIVVAMYVLMVLCPIYLCVAVIMAVLHRGMGLGLNVSFLSASAAVIIGVGAVLAAGYPDPGSPLATSDITASLFVILPNIVACIVVYLRVVRKASPERRATDAATGG